MADFTITHRIEAPDLVVAINNLATALKSSPVPAKENPTVPVQNVPAGPVEVTSIAENTPVQGYVTGTVAPVTAAPTAPVAPATPAVPTVAAPTPVAETPATTAKVYTFDDITAAGSQLLEAGKINDLITLLRSFGVQAVNQLKPEQFPAVMEGLKKLGAKI